MRTTAGLAAFSILAALTASCGSGGGTEEATTSTAAPTTTEPPPPWERLVPEVSLGAFMPTPQLPREGYHFADPATLAATGANSVLLGLIVPFRSDGTVERGHVDHGWLGRAIDDFHAAGLAVGVTLGPINIDHHGEPQPVWPEIREAVLAGMTVVVADVATTLEEHGAEVFAPINEADHQLGIEAASAWSQEVLPVIRERFGGRVMWKGSLFEHANPGPDPDIDFTGYDIVGFTLFPFTGIERYPQRVGEILDEIGAWAAADGVTELWAAEFGSYDPVPIGRDEVADSLRIVFEEGAGRLGGFFAFDPPRGFGTSLGEPDLEEAVRAGFASLQP